MAPLVKRSGFDPFITQKPKTTTYDRSNKFDPFIVDGDALTKMRENERPENAPYLPMSKDATNEAITNSLFGVSGSDVSTLDVGAFKDIPQAKSIVNQAKKLEEQTKTAKFDPVTMAQNIADKAYGDSTAGDIDWGVASLLYFSKMAENASKPGATGLSSAASAFSQPAAYIMQKDKEKQALQAKKGATVASLVPALVKAGKTKNFKTLTDIEAQKLGYDTKDGTITFQQDTSTNEVNQVTKTPLVDMTQKGKGIWATDGAKANIKAFAGYREDSKKARQALGTYDQLLDILADPDFETNYKEEKLLGVRKIVSSLGLGDKDDLAKITKADLFRTKTYELVLASVSQMKGALSDKELNFLQDQTASLGKNKETNQIVLLTMKKRLEAASKFDDFALEWQEKNLKDDEGKPRTIHTDLEYERMMRDWRKEPINQENPYQYVERLSNEYKAQLVNQIGGELNDEGNIVSGSLEQTINGKTTKIPAGSNLEQLKAEEIANKIEGKFARSQFKKIFGGYFSLSGQGDRT